MSGRVNNMDINYAVVSSFERSKDERQKRTSARMFNILLMAVFFLALMAGLACGAIMYRSVSDTQVHNNNVNLHTGIIANTVHANDALFAIETGEGPEGRALVLIETLDSGTYETRIYKYRDSVVQEYAIAGRPYNPATATPLFESKTFEFSFDGQLLSVQTDRGSCDVALRSRQGGKL